MVNPRLLDKIENRNATVAVVGQGYVGLSLAMAASRAGYPVVGLESDPYRYKSLLDGKSFIEDVTDVDLDYALDRGYTPANDSAQLQGFDIAVITVPTPLIDGRPNLDMVEVAAREVGRALQPDTLVILESTTYPGTTTEIVRPILEQVSGLVAGDDFYLGYSPERIDPGNPTWSLENTPKIVAGTDPRSTEMMEAFYGCFVDALVPVADPAVAELAKLIENTFRHVNIALMNELAIFAHELDVDIWSAIDAASTKPFGFMPFRPGPGVGGHCLPVDPSYLSWRVKQRLGRTFHFVELANEINATMPGYIVRRVQALLNTHGLAVHGARILVLGLAYKANTGDARESPATAVVDALTSLGATVTVVDPHVDTTSRQHVHIVRQLDPDDLQQATLVLIMARHSEFDVEQIAEQASLVFDATCRGNESPDGIHRI